MGTAYSKASVTTAASNLRLASEHLREALHDATMIEALIVMPLIKRAAYLANDVAALRDALA